VLRPLRTGSLCVFIDQRRYFRGWMAGARRAGKARMVKATRNILLAPFLNQGLRNRWSSGLRPVK
jgi:hypothetical protein